jgi:hypothetical protein
MEARYPKAVIWTPDSLANERARDKGLNVVHPRGLDKAIVARFRKAGLETTHEKFGVETGDGKKPLITVLDDPTEDMQAMAGFVKKLGQELVGFAPDVEFATIRRVRNANFCADWSGRTMRFFVNKLPKDFFERLGPYQIGVVLHEMAHHNKGNNADGPHGLAFRNKLEELAGEAVFYRLSEDERYWHGKKSEGNN